MQINSESSLHKQMATVIEVALFLTAVAWVSKTYVATLFARKATARNLGFALRLDPGNSDYHLQLGKLFQYSAEDFNPEQAVAHLKRATELNPRNPEPWVDLAAALESEGKASEAEACLRRADTLAPNDPVFQWAIGNSSLLRGEVDEAFRHFKVVLAGSSQYNPILFNTAWKASSDPKKILQQLIPDKVQTEFDYLYFLVGTGRYPEAQSVWQRIARSSESFPATRAAEYINNLIQTHRPQEAYQVWTDLRNKGLLKPTYEETSQNLVINGEFEESILNMGFDWRVTPLAELTVGLDATDYHSPGHAFLIEFSGKENVDYRNLFQYVRVTRGRSYRLHGFLKTEGITTDSGPRLEVRDAYDPSLLEKFSDDLRGSSASWTSVTLDFTAGPRTDLIVLGVARLPSRRFDSLIAGRVWVDDLSLTEIQDR